MKDWTWFQELTHLMGEFRGQIVQALPNILAALAVLLLGYFVALLLKTLVFRLIENTKNLFPSLLPSKNIELAKPLSEISGRLVFWLVLFLFFTLSSEVLGLKLVTTWLGKITTYFPSVLGAAMIGVLGYIASNVVRDMVSSGTAVAYSGAVGRILQVSILVVTIVLVVSQLGLEIRFLTFLCLIVLSTLLGGVALAFGLGSKHIVSNILSSHYLQKRYEVGNFVRIGSFEGRISEITPTSVVLETESGYVMVPAREFTEMVSTLLTKEA